MTSAATHPGALSGFFLAMVHQKICQGVVRQTKQLRLANVSQWVTSHSGVSEVRDVREAATLGYVMDLIQQEDLESAMDVIAQRLVAIQKKAQGTDWKKAENLELASHGMSSLPGGMLRLTQ